MRQGSTKKAWSVINNLLCNKNHSKKRISNITYNNANLTNDQDIANAFNDFFVSIGEKLAANIDSNTDALSYLDAPVNESIYLNPVSDEEICAEIHNLKIGKSPGMDGFNAKVIKSVSRYISPILVHIFNLCFESGVYPESLKAAKVVPLFKKGDVTLPENYRPISLWSCFNKLLEKVIDKRMRSFLLRQNIFYDFQFGFRSGHSTIQALLEITNNVRQHLDNREHALGLYLDLKKAFDTVNHTILKEKLWRYGIRGKCHDLLKSYLTNREQITYSSLPVIQPRFNGIHGINGMGS